MSPLVVSLVMFVCVCGSMFAGMLIARALPEHHLRPESRETVKQGLALIATLAGLVIALLVAATKGAYDANTAAVQKLAADAQLLDRLLSLYGPETNEARQRLHSAMAATLEHIWPEDASQKADLTPGEARPDMEAVYAQVAHLRAETELEQALRSRMFELMGQMGETRLLLFARQSSSIPLPFLLVLLFWLMILLGGFGLMAPPNATAIVVLVVCSLSVSCAMFLIVELDRPFEGLMRISSAPLRDALARLGT